MDWGAIATIVGTLITVGVAWGISKQWRNQKNSEIISIESKQLIILVQNFRDELIYAEHIINYPTGKIDDEKLDRIRNLAYRIKEQVNFLVLLLEDNNSPILKISTITYNNYIKIRKLSFLKFDERRKGGSSEIVDDFENEIKPLRELLVLYYKHQK